MTMLTLLIIVGYVMKFEYQDLPEQVYSAIKEMIMHGDLFAGQKLVPDELSERLGVSRTPIQTALGKLEKEFLIDIIPRRGAYVKTVTLKELKDIFDIRLRLEPLGSFNTALSATDEAVAELESYLEEFFQAVQKNEMKRVWEIDYKFHMTIHRFSGNQFLYNMIGSYSLVVLSNISKFLLDPGDSLKDHKALVEAIKKHDAAEAEELMRSHLNHARMVLDTLQESDINATGAEDG